MDHDFLISWIGIATGYYAARDPEYTDEWGITWRWVQYPTGAYTEMVKRPFANLDDPHKITLPDFSQEDRYDGLRKLIDEYGREYGIVGSAPCALFEAAWYLRGLEKVLEDLVSNQDFMDAYLDRLMSWIETAGTKMVQLGVDVIWTGDDLGTQDSMLISPSIFRQFFKPRYARLFQKWKATNPHVKIAFHSDGCIYPVIKDFIEIGLDILNPVQPKSMDPGRLKKEFGKNLVLWGTIDIQEVMPFGSVEDVVQEVKLRLRTAGPGGGLLLGPTHNIQPETPIENIMAFYEAAKTYGQYPLTCK